MRAVMPEAVHSCSKLCLLCLTQVSGGGSPLGRELPSPRHKEFQTPDPVDDAEPWVAGSALSAGSHLCFFFFFLF